ncbi:hypothetical protein NDU88_004074 [Pleurodeles waltl]|uniref:Uncharacterized protein n=1 Tax=Pleurodeles waltl TaxID=8319 RepID=A0AAV7V0U4_PLEWA|nr:hypothetical protein NDU88_004074 [Pleurodeles waltl]
MPLGGNEDMVQQKGSSVRKGESPMEAHRPIKGTGHCFGKKRRARKPGNPSNGKANQPQEDDTGCRSHHEQQDKKPRGRTPRETEEPTRAKRTVPTSAATGHWQTSPEMRAQHREGTMPKKSNSTKSRAGKKKNAPTGMSPKRHLK